MKSITGIVKNKIETRANLEAENSTLLNGQICIESDTKKIKTGDGTTTYVNLPYSDSGENVRYLSSYDDMQTPIDELDALEGGTLYIDKDYDMTPELVAKDGSILLRSYVNIVGLGFPTLTSTNEDYLHFYGVDTHSFQMKNLHIVGPGMDAAGGGGMVINRSALANIENILFENVLIEDVANDALFINTPILSTFYNVKALKVSGHGFNMYGGTSTNFFSCYAITTTKAGFYFDTMTYCALDGCASEVTGCSYQMHTSRNISLSGCGSEHPLNRSVDFPGYAFRIESGGENIVLSACYSTTSEDSAIMDEGINNTYIGVRTVSTAGTYSLDDTAATGASWLNCSWDENVASTSSTIKTNI